MDKMPLYILTAFLLVLGAYLRSPLVGISPVALWAIDVAAVVLNQKNKDAEIKGVIVRLSEIEKELKAVKHDVNNVAERASTILGENYR